MNLSFLLSILTSFFLLTSCGEKPTIKTIGPENSKGPTAAKDYSYDESQPSPEFAASEALSPIFAPLNPSFALYPTSGYGRRDGGGSYLDLCSSIEGDSCDTGDHPPFDQGTIFCERGHPICRPNITDLLYYLYIDDFIQSFIEIPTSNVLVDSSTLSSKYLAGRAPIYDREDQKAGNCSASFLCMQNEDGIYTDISNYLSVNNGLIVSWFTPTTLINLELDTIVNSMVTECIVLASTKIGYNPFYGETFNMIVSSDDQKIYFQLTRIDE